MLPSCGKWTVQGTRAILKREPKPCGSSRRVETLGPGSTGSPVTRSSGLQGGRVVPPENLRPPFGGRFSRPRGAKVKATSQTMGRLAVLFVVAVALVSGVACGQSAEAKKQKALARGEQYLRDGKVNEAIIEFRSALQVHQDFVPAVQALGRAYMAKSWYGDAARELQRAQKLSPDALPIAADFGRTLVQVGALQDAEAQAARILAKEPQNRDGLYIRGAALLGQWNAQEALDLLEPVSASGIGPE